MIKDFPKRVKHSRVFRYKLNKHHKATSHIHNNFYRYGLKALETGKLKKNHFQAIYRLLKRLYKRRVFIKFNISLTIPVTKKPIETRMGKGKAPKDHWECAVKKGMIILEFGGDIELVELNFGLRMIRLKLPIHSKLVQMI